jgi:peptidoglycan/LPS O-acetylase OafA/YrhL
MPLRPPTPAPIYPLVSLRFAGSLAIFFFHAFEQLNRDRGVVMFGSTAAVSLFFVLSGFILYSIYQPRVATDGVLAFYLKRFARLWPLHAACLLGVLVLRISDVPGSWFGAGLNPTAAPDEPTWAMLGLNLLMLHSWVPSPAWVFSFNGVSWFVATEFGFCLLFPVLARGGRSILWTWLASLVVLVVGLFVAQNVWEQRPDLSAQIHAVVQCHPLFRLFEFTSGMVVAWWVTAGWKLSEGRYAVAIHALAELVALVFFALSLHRGPLAQGLFTLATWSHWQTAQIWLSKGGASLPASMALLWVLATSRGPVATLLSQPLAVYLGKLSYAFYLVHTLVLIQIVRHTPEHLSPTVGILGGLLISVALAALLNLAVETPCRNWIVTRLDRSLGRQSHRSFTAPPLSQTLYPAILTMAVALLGFWAIANDSQRDPTLPRSEATQITFEDCAILHHVGVEHAEATLILTLVWEKYPDYEAVRIGHLLHADGTFRHLPSNLDLFPDGRIGIENIVIPHDQLQDSVGVAVGLFADGKLVQHVNYNRTLRGGRLVIYDRLRDAIPETVLQSTKRSTTIPRN